MKRLHSPVTISVYALWKGGVLLFIFLALFNIGSGQLTNPAPKVLDSLTRKPIAEVLVTIYADGRLLQTLRTNEAGEYSASTTQLEPGAVITLQYRHIGYIAKTIQLQGDRLKLPTYVYLKASSAELQEVEVKAQWRVQEAGDTVKYNPDAFKGPTTKTVADLFANIPGFKVLPDGRLLYQNKVVHALLLDGDNLTDEQYGIVNKNLDVRAVAGIQVFNNYERNRVLAEAGESNKLAVNLTVSDAFKGKISGNVQAGIAAPPRGLLQTSLVSLNRKSKNFLTASGNNVASDNKADAFKVKDATDAGGSRSLETLPTQVLQPPVMGIPDLPAAFTEDNRTVFGSLVGLTKVGRQSDITYRLSAEQHKVGYLSQGLSRFTIDSFTRWSIADSNRLRKQVAQLAASVTWRHNASSNWAGDWYINGLQYLPEHELGRYMQLSVVDTTHLKHHRRAGMLQAGYDGAFKIPRLGVYHIAFGYEINSSNVSDQLFSRRFQDVFKYVGTDALLIRQQYTLRTTQWHGKLEQVKKWAKITGRFGVKAMHYSGHWAQQLDWTPAMQNERVPQNQDRTQYISSSLAVYQHLNWRPAQKHHFRAHTSLGVENLRVGTQQKRVPVYMAQAEHTWRFKPRFQWVSSVYAEQKLPSLDWFGPDTVLHGQYGLAAGMDTISNLRQWSGKTAISYSNLTGNNFLLEYTFTRWQNIVGWLPVLVPEISFFQAAFLPRQSQHQVSYEFRRYIPVLAGRIVHSVTFTRQQGQLSVNNQPVFNRIDNQSMGLKWISAFRGKVQAETDARVTLSSIRQNADDAVISSQVWEYQWHTKLVYQPNSKLHVGLKHTALFYTGASCFAGQLFAERRISSRVNMQLTWHNVLGARNLSYVFNTPNSSGSTSFELVRGYVLAKFTFQL